jgi:SNF2 family DNA or RNA helicase
MILVDVNEKEISINLQETTLKAYQLSQLQFWNFSNKDSNNILKVQTDSIGLLISKVLGYFEEEKIACELSEHCQSFVEIRKQIIDKLISVKEVCSSFKEGNFVREEFDRFAEFVKNNVRRKLRDHQLKAAYHLYISENAANFSVPGSGKTSVVITVYEKLRLIGKVNLILVIGPPSCFGPWKTEFNNTLDRDPKARLLAGGRLIDRKNEYYKIKEDRGELYLTTFQTLLNDQEELITFLNNKDLKTFLVVDEAHYIKQLNGNWAQSVLKLSKHASYRCVLTGTPIPQSYSDIFNLFDFLWNDPQILTSENKVKIQLCEKKGDQEQARTILKNEIGPLFYRVRKKDLGLLEPVFHAPQIIEMNKYEQVLYKAIENRIKDFTKDDYLKNIDLVTKLRRGRIMRLRQCSSYAKLLSNAIEGYDETILNDSDLASIITNYDNLEKPSKLLYLEKLVRLLRKESQKILIWSNFVGSLEMIRNHLKDNGMNCEIIYGKTPIESTSVDDENTREAIRDRFVDNSSGLDILIANPAACAESISLHKTCFNAIYYDLSYNCAQYLQSLDRIHRIGGSEINVAHYHFLQNANTIDSDIKHNLDQKADRMYRLIEEDYSIYSLNMFEEDDSEIQAYTRLFGN